MKTPASARRSSTSRPAENISDDDEHTTIPDKQANGSNSKAVPETRNFSSVSDVQTLQQLREENSELRERYISDSLGLELSSYFICVYISTNCDFFSL